MNLFSLDIFFFSYYIIITVYGAIDFESLGSVGLGSDVFVSDIAVYLNRAFLAIPRTVCQNNISNPTLVDIPWKEYNTIIKLRYNKHIDKQLWAKCDDLQSAVSLAKEGIKSKLWILDQGSQYCNAKIVAFSLFQNGFINQKIDLSDIPREGLNTLVIENSTTLGSHRAFVSNAGSNKILACYLDILRCKTIDVTDADNPARKLIIQSIAFSKLSNEIFFSEGPSRTVFSINLSSFSNNNWKVKGVVLSATSLGSMLGESSGFETDLKNGLLYYLVRDYAIVRWIIGKPMTAENHDVLGQSYTRMPYVSRIFTDPQNGIWALVNPFNAQDCQTDLTNFQSLQRAVKIMRYNRVLDMFL
ncbi:hypothetical protein GWI33_017903 [Rhynchophorus ferrugineus]|uniref:Uncharacterized protein n=1 Tax=Rhynchophorus ferrugineus TaxID=354439 RepID=A0A834M207_RHYFE|nr:hypothetical protein GWI33_017903 [Rhynchophorus ferrugineus]